MNNIKNIQEYIPTVYVNDSEPDLDETNLNKTEQAIKRVTDAANKAIDALKQLDREKLALSAISNVLSDATDKVPSLALANTMQLAINDLNSNLKNKVDINDIQKGSTAGISCAANAITESTITFPRAFNSAPKVVVSFYSNTKLAKYGMMTPMVCNVTTTNFKVRIANASDTALTPAIYWIARE